MINTQFNVSRRRFLASAGMLAARCSTTPFGLASF